MNTIEKMREKLINKIKNSSDEQLKTWLGVGPFMTGTHGEIGEDGLPEGVWISPMFGCDVQCNTLYKKSK
jgi:hypothetical protein